MGSEGLGWRGALGQLWPGPGWPRLPFLQASLVGVAQGSGRGSALASAPVTPETPREQEGGVP